MKVDLLERRSQEKQYVLDTRATGDLGELTGELTAPDPLGNELLMEDWAGNDVEFYNSIDGSAQNLFDMAIAVDFWADLDTLWPGMGTLSEQYAPMPL